MHIVKLLTADLSQTQAAFPDLQLGKSFIDHNLAKHAFETIYNVYMHF